MAQVVALTAPGEFGGAIDDFAISSVPEPAPPALMLTGRAGLMARMHRRAA